LRSGFTQQILKKLRLLKRTAIDAGAGAELHRDQCGLRQMLRNVLLDEPRRAVKMDQQRYRPVGINPRANEKPRALERLQVHATTFYLSLREARMRARLLNHR
jgi:hypothetical protein